MPEAPELTIVREVLERHAVGASVVSARVVRPTVFRTLSEIDVAGDIEGRSFTNVSRYGKSVTLTLSDGMALVIFSDADWPASQRYHLTAQGIDEAAWVLRFDTPSDFVRAYPMSRE